MVNIANVTTDSESSFSRDGLSPQRGVHAFAKQMLKKTMFVGTYQENRYVPSLNEYKSIIKVSDTETKFIQNLNAVLDKIRNVYGCKKWVGITKPNTIGAPEGYNLWVDLDQEILGTFWFNVRGVKFLYNEISLKLEIIRPYEISSSDQFNEEISFEDVSQGVKDWCKSSSVQFFAFLKSFGINDVKNCALFLSVLILTIAHVIKYLLEYLLKLCKVLSDFIKVCQPIFIAVINSITRVISNLLLAIVLILRPQQYPVRNNYPAVTYQSPFYRQRTYGNRILQSPYLKQSSVRITEVE